MALVAVALLGLTIAAGPRPETTVQEFLGLYLKQSVSTGNFEGARALGAHLTKRLRRVLEDAEACERDWARQQPRDLTLKPPFVDCCIFASPSEGLPTTFRLIGTEALPDGRQKVEVEYTIVDTPVPGGPPHSGPMSWHWRDAIVLTLVNDRYLVDDVIYLRHSPPHPPDLLSSSFRGCRGRVWVGEK
jgi:hypothetical protein